MSQRGMLRPALAFPLLVLWVLPRAATAQRVTPAFGTFEARFAEPGKSTRASGFQDDTHRSYVWEGVAVGTGSGLVLGLLVSSDLCGNPDSGGSSCLFAIGGGMVAGAVVGGIIGSMITKH